MNNAQRLIGIIGAVILMLVAVYPRWDVSGTVRYDFKVTYDDNDKADYYTSIMPFHNQARGCIFVNHASPEVIYTPPDERMFDGKKGYSTKTCVGDTLVDYQWRVNERQVVIELLAFLIPTLLLILVFRPSKDD